MVAAPVRQYLESGAGSCKKKKKKNPECSQLHTVINSHLKSNDGSIGHGWMFQQLSFELRWSHLVPLNFDEFLKMKLVRMVSSIKLWTANE